MSVPIGDEPSLESMRTSGFAARRLGQPGVRWTDVVKQKTANPKSLCPTRPRNDFVSESKAEQPLNNAMARNPLVLLDQHLQSLAKEDDDAIRKRNPGRG